MTNSYEARTGKLLSKTGHIQKVGQGRNWFVSLLKSNEQLTIMERNFVIRHVVEANRAIRLIMQAGSKYSAPISQEVLNIIGQHPYLSNLSWKRKLATPI